MGAPSGVLPCFEASEAEPKGIQELMDNAQHGRRIVDPVYAAVGPLSGQNLGGINGSAPYIAGGWIGYR